MIMNPSQLTAQAEKATVSSIYTKVVVLKI